MTSKIRVSAGTACALGLKKIKTDVLPTTAYLMLGENCAHDCSFCAQARSSEARSGRLSRVSWPAFPAEEVWQALRTVEGTLGDAHANNSAAAPVKRVCLQVVHSQEAFNAPSEDSSPFAANQVEAGLSGLSGLPGLPGLSGLSGRVASITGRLAVPLCVSAHLTSADQIRTILAAGAERVSIPLDAAAPAVFRRHKTGNWEKTLALLKEAASLFPGRVGTHLIAGLGETEEEMIALIQSLLEPGITVALFAFTPVPGTALEMLSPPDIASYRRIQAAHFLMRQKLAHAQEMIFRDGILISLGLPQEIWENALQKGDAFRTSGCPDCNRPYYNERPGGVMYNYPRPLTPGEVEEAFDLLRTTLDD